MTSFARTSSKVALAIAVLITMAGLSSAQAAAPQVTPGATQVSVTPVNRFGANSTVVSATFTDTDQPGVGGFTATFRIREPSNLTVLTLVNNQPNGGGGLTIADNGGGSYTASYTYDPGGAQTLGLYDLLFEVSDGVDVAVDGYANNLDELEINQQNAPSVFPGAALVSVSPVNRFGANATVVSAVFTDADQPGIGGFTATFRIREPNNTTELTLVNNQPNGGGGLTITDLGGGLYNASYNYDPDVAQALGLYDLHFEVSDGTDVAVDGYANNLDELEVIHQIAPAVAAGATQVSISPVNRFGLNTTVISADFTDGDQPGIGAFTATFKIREPDSATELILIDDLSHGTSGLTIADNGGGSYAASYVYNPDAARTLGLYDLYFAVSDGIDVATDGYADNPDELEINEVFVNNAPVLDSGATRALPSSVNRLGTNSTVVSASFSDRDNPGIGAFTVTFRIREPNNATEVILVNDQPHGAGGLTITDNGGSYTARFTYDPAAGQTLGLYDLYCEVSDSADVAIDGYANNLDEFEIVETVVNTPPALTAGVTAATPGSIARLGAGTTELSATFTDADAPGIGAFAVTFVLRKPYNAGLITVADALSHGMGGLTVTNNGGGSYTARIDWNPPDDATIGPYDLFCLISDGADQAEDGFDANPDELSITSAGENAPPIVPSDNTFATPPAIERVGANSTTIAATFSDADAPVIGAFSVTFKLRDPNDVDEIVLADNVGDGVGGVSIADLGGGSYTASIGWDPPDIQNTGHYDLYFHVTDGVDTSYDGFANNLDEFEVYDAISNNPPTIVVGATTVVPSSITRIGSEYTMIQSTFSDVDVPGIGAFTVTFRVQDPSSVVYTIANAAAHKQQGVRIESVSGNTYRASILWDPPIGQVTGAYDLFFEVTDNNAATASDGYAANPNELTVTATAIPGDGNLLRRTNDQNNCGGPNSACHDISDHESQNCLVCHTPHDTPNIYLVRDTIQTPNSGPKEVILKTLGIGDPFNDPDPTPGDPTSGVMADDADGVFTGVCEVCHTSTVHHRNDGSHPPPEHHNAEDCTVCHSHGSGFAAGESGGGSSCSCHNSIFVAMDSTSLLNRHILANIDPDYSPGVSGMYSVKNCLTCHVDHDIFRPDLNPGVGQRAKNLRVDYGTDPVQGNSAHLAGTDYSSTGQGGLCLSCHAGPSCQGCHSAHVPVAPASTFDHTFIPKADYDSATSTHNYTVTSTFGTDGSGFQANCVKCHNDNMSKSYQNSTYKFSVHGSPFNKILDSLGMASPPNPLEEDFCYRCHSTTSNANAGSNLDHYGVKPMAAGGPLEIEGDMGLSSIHPVGSFSAIHTMDEKPDSMARHVECTDCHNPHAATSASPPLPALSGALKGVRGVDTSGASVVTAAYSYEICFKCHADRPGAAPVVPRVVNSMNTRLEFHPSGQSFHPVAAVGKNDSVPSLTIPPWDETSIMACEDCHGTAGGGASGLHGSEYRPILRLMYLTADNTGEADTAYALCYSCHDRNSILNNDSFGKHKKHIQGEDAPCATCHDPHGVNTPVAGDGTHLINFNTAICSPSKSGRLEFIDDGLFQGTCYVDCHGKDHDPKSY